MRKCSYNALVGGAAARQDLRDSSRSTALPLPLGSFEVFPLASFFFFSNGAFSLTTLFTTFLRLIMGTATSSSGTRRLTLPLRIAGTLPSEGEGTIEAVIDAVEGVGGSEDNGELDGGRRTGEGWTVDVSESGDEDGGSYSTARGSGDGSTALMIASRFRFGVLTCVVRPEIDEQGEEGVGARWNVVVDCVRTRAVGVDDAGSSNSVGCEFDDGLCNGALDASEAVAVSVNASDPPTAALDRTGRSGSLLPALLPLPILTRSSGSSASLEGAAELLLAQTKDLARPEPTARCLACSGGKTSMILSGSGESSSSVGAMSWWRDMTARTLEAWRAGEAREIIVQLLDPP